MGVQVRSWDSVRIDHLEQIIMELLSAMEWCPLDTNRYPALLGLMKRNSSLIRDSFQLETLRHAGLL